MSSMLAIFSIVSLMIALSSNCILCRDSTLPHNLKELGRIHDLCSFKLTEIKKVGGARYDVVGLRLSGTFEHHIVVRVPYGHGNTEIGDHMEMI
jgi:hypothetical protein